MTSRGMTLIPFYSHKINNVHILEALNIFIVCYALDCVDISSPSIQCLSYRFNSLFPGLVLVMEGEAVTL
jgi:hypothetical protein